MIGGSNSVPLCIMGGSKDTAETPFIHAIAENCTNQNIYFSYLFRDASDHEPFRLNNIDAVTFVITICQRFTLFQISPAR